MSATFWFVPLGDVGPPARRDCLLTCRGRQCEKHAKKEEALAKLNDGVKFDEVARNYSEDKARAGVSTWR